MDARSHALEAQIPALRRYAFGLTRDHAAADDLVQDCLERALSRWYLRRPDGDLRAWLFTITRNLHISNIRQSKRRGLHLAFEEGDEPVSQGAQEHALGVRDVLDTLDQMPEDHKSLLLLVGVEDMSYDQAASILGIPIGTVMSRLSRARRRLRELLDGRQPVSLRRVK